MRCSVSSPDAQRSIFDELRGVSSGDETLCRMFDISSQTKSFLKEKLRMQILSSVSSNFQTLIKHLSLRMRFNAINNKEHGHLLSVSGQCSG